MVGEKKLHVTLFSMRRVSRDARDAAKAQLEHLTLTLTLTRTRTRTLTLTLTRTLTLTLTLTLTRRSSSACVPRGAAYPSAPPTARAS